MTSLFERTADLWAPDRLGALYQIRRRFLLALINGRRELRRTTLPWGLPILVDVHDIIGRTIWTRGVYEPGVSEAIWRLVDQGDTALDIGANIGYMTSIMALRAGPLGSVYSFEPHPGVCKALRKNLSLFAADKRTSPVTLHEMALGSDSGKAYLVTDEAWNENQGTAHFSEAPADMENRAEVDVRHLDDMIPAKTIALAKLDVEGYEASVLGGARNLIDSHSIRTLVYEDHTSGGGEPRSLLEGAGYTVYLLDRTRDGLLLSPPDVPPTFRHEATNFVATVVPGEVRDKLSPPGWRLLDSKLK